MDLTKPTDNPLWLKSMPLLSYSLKQSVVPRPEASASPGKLWEMEIPEIYSRFTKSETLEVAPSILSFNKLSKQFWSTFKFENHWPKSQLQEAVTKGVCTVQVAKWYCFLQCARIYLSLQGICSVQPDLSYIFHSCSQL